CRARQRGVVADLRTRRERFGAPRERRALLFAGGQQDLSRTRRVRPGCSLAVERLPGGGYGRRNYGLQEIRDAETKGSGRFDEGRSAARRQFRKYHHKVPRTRSAGGGN